MKSKLEEDLKKLFSKEQLLTSLEEKLCYSYDATNKNFRPDAVVLPHSAEDVVKAVMAGADVAQVCSALLQNGIGYIGELVQGVEQRMDAEEMGSIEDIKGTLGLENYAEPTALARASYIELMRSYQRI